MPRLTVLAPVVAAALAIGTGVASAQHRPAAARAAGPRRMRPSVKRHAAKYKPARVSATLARKLRGKPVMAVARDQAEAYARDMKNTVEVLFEPTASRWGHILVRVGDRVYDLPGPFGAQDRAFKSMGFWGPTYGFVFDSSPGEVAELHTAFRALIASRPPFSTFGAGDGTYSCAGFVTAILSEKAPQLEIGLSAAAAGTARRLFESGLHQGVTLYGRAADETGDEAFEFQKLE